MLRSIIKRLSKKIKYFRCLDNYPEFNLGSFLVALCCTFLIVIATFTQMPLIVLSISEDAFIHPVDFFSRAKSISEFTRGYSYIPQIPAVLFIAALLGPRIGLFSVALYIIAGLIGYPIFASGGGIKYCTQIQFGYILGYFIGVYLVGKVLAAKVTDIAVIRAAIVGVFAIHLFGILYLSIVMFFTGNSIFSIFGWIWALSGIQLPFDLLISYITITLARPVRTLLWIAMD